MASRGLDVALTSQRSTFVHHQHPWCVCGMALGVCWAKHPKCDVAGVHALITTFTPVCPLLLDIAHQCLHKIGNQTTPLCLHSPAPRPANTRTALSSSVCKLALWTKTSAPCKKTKLCMVREMGSGRSRCMQVREKEMLRSSYFTCRFQKCAPT